MQNQDKNKDIFKPPSQLDLIVFDFDGVFTDNKVYVMEDGTESVVCDRRDGLGIKMLNNLEIPMFILSTESNNVVNARSKKLGLIAHTSCENKGQFLREYFDKNKIDPANVIYIGNDLNDLESMQLVGFSACPSDSHCEIKDVSSFVLKANGGDGAIRELAELLVLKISGKTYI